MAHSLLNKSTAKEEYSFIKSPRFQTTATNTFNVSQNTLTKLSDFDKIVLNGKRKENHSFGSTFRRFDYY